MLFDSFAWKNGPFIFCLPDHTLRTGSKQSATHSRSFHGKHAIASERSMLSLNVTLTCFSMWIVDGRLNLMARKT